MAGIERQGDQGGNDREPRGDLQEGESDPPGDDLPGLTYVTAM